MTAWHRNEYILKGVFLGLWAFVALQVSDNTARIDILWNLGWMGAGLLVGLALGIARLLKMGVRPQQNWGAFPLLVLLENPTLIGGGILIGLVCGVLTGREAAEPWAAHVTNLFNLSFADIRHDQSADGRRPGDWLGYCVAGGALLGFGLYRLRGVEDIRKQFWLGFLVVTALIYLAPNYVGRVPGYKFPDMEAPTQSAVIKAGKNPAARESLVKACEPFAKPETFNEAAFRHTLAKAVADSPKESHDVLAAAADGLTTEMTRQRAADVPAAALATLRAFDARVNLGLFLLIGLPFLYLLIFVSDAEEAVPDVVAFSALLGVSLYLIDLGGLVTIGVYLAYLVPLALYYVYATRVMPGLRVFKHILRGFSYLNLDRLRESIYFFRRALLVDAESPLAKQGMVHLHDTLTVDKIERDPELVQVLDFNLCLDRAERLLNGRPTNNQRAEADRFLDLVEQKGRGFQARVDYLSAVSRAHARDYDGAAELLQRLLDPNTPYHGPVRNTVLYKGWFMALVPSKELEKRVGWAELDQPGRRIEAIGAVERFLAENPQDPDALGLKRSLYGRLTEGEFTAAAATGLPKDFNYDYVEQLGMALVDDPDPDRRERGMGFLRIAGRGLPERGPGIFRKLYGVSERAGDHETARKYLEQIKVSGTTIGPRNLPTEQRDTYFWALRRLSAEAEALGDATKAEADAARDRGDTTAMAAKDAEAKPHFEDAIAELRLYLEGGGRNELETYRKLADIYGKGRSIPNAIINAILMTETGLTYSSTDPDLLKKKDTFYFSIDPEQVTAVRDKVKGYFDTSYCITKAMSVLNTKDDDPALIEWAVHLAKLARVMQPSGNGVRLVEARCLLRQGHRDEGLTIMEDIRAGAKGSGDDQDAWYGATKILGQLYLEELSRPDLALQAFLDYKEYSKSGADTLYMIARCYEAQNDNGNAARFYEAVTAYESHPRFWDAKEALKRVRGT